MITNQFPYSKQQKKSCQVFLLCKSPATTSIQNSILGKVPACQRCKNKMKKIEKSGEKK